MSEIYQKEFKRPLVSLRFPNFKSIEEFLEQTASAKIAKIQSEKREGCETRFCDTGDNVAFVCYCLHFQQYLNVM